MSSNMDAVDEGEGEGAAKGALDDGKTSMSSVRSMTSDDAALITLAGGSRAVADVNPVHSFFIEAVELVFKACANVDLDCGTSTALGGSMDLGGMNGSCDFGTMRTWLSTIEFEIDDGSDFCCSLLDEYLTIADCDKFL
jgi:hypothetical protein